MVKMFGKQWKVKSITYKEKRKLWHGSIKAFDGDVVKQDEYFALMENVELLSGLKEKDYVDKDKKPLDMSQIDLLLQEVFTQYMGIEKKD